MSSAPAPSTTLRSASIDSSDRELVLMLACCSTQLINQADPPVRELLTGGIEWARFLDLIEKHGVLPLVQQSLMNVTQLIPAEPRHELQRRFSEHVRRTLYLTKLLGRVMAGFDEANVSCLPYKGPVLSQRLYGDVAMRQFSDLDFFVCAPDVSLTKNILRKIGFVPHTNLRGVEERALIASGYELTFDGMGNRNLIEIQWSALPRFYSVDLAVEEFFSSAQIVALADNTVRTLSDENLLLTLCVHAAKHGWAKLSWICDIAQLSTISKMGWAHVAERATALGIERIIGTTFFLVGKILHRPVPAEMESLIRRDPEIRVLGAEIFQRMARDSDLDPESIAYFRLMLRARERVRDRIWLVTRLILTPTFTEWSLIKLPERLFPLYRLVRVFRLIGNLLIKRHRLRRATS
jgi:Uncharacterised nucleotidyltransferase